MSGGSHRLKGYAMVGGTAVMFGGALILGGAVLVVLFGATEEGLAGSPEEAVGEAGASR